MRKHKIKMQRNFYTPKWQNLDAAQNNNFYSSVKCVLEAKDMSLRILALVLKDMSNVDVFSNWGSHNITVIKQYVQNQVQE